MVLFVKDNVPRGTINFFYFFISLLRGLCYNIGINQPPIRSIKMDREMKFLFASLDRNGDFRLYHICSSTAYDALVNLILQVERP